MTSKFWIFIWESIWKLCGPEVPEVKEQNTGGCIQMWIAWACATCGSKSIPISRGTFSQNRYPYQEIFQKKYRFLLVLPQNTKVFKNRPISRNFLSKTGSMSRDSCKKQTNKNFGRLSPYLLIWKHPPHTHTHTHTHTPEKKKTHVALDFQAENYGILIPGGHHNDARRKIKRSDQQNCVYGAETWWQQEPRYALCTYPCIHLHHCL